MSAQKARDLLLKIEDPGNGFVTVAGLRSRQISLNAESVDVTDSESAGRWRELLSGAGLRRASITGSGIFKDAASDERIRTIFFDGLILSLIHISEPTRLRRISYAVFCLKKKNNKNSSKPTLLANTLLV